jgi:hypothetical protein
MSNKGGNMENELDEMITDIIVSIQAAQTMADRFKKDYCLMDDLSVQESTEYTRQRAVEIVKPRRGTYNVCGRDER